jgi:hypothetical protein
MLAPDTELQGRYRVVRPLGQGGMGAVYEAVDHRFNRSIALKEMFLAGEPLRKAFEREARLLNSLRHPALPVVIDYFAEGERQFLVMDYVPGDDLGAIVAPGVAPPPAYIVLRWADQILDALVYLHEHDPPILHRDIKPQNLKLTPRGNVMLLDFGLAKGSAAESSQLTGARSVAGYTPHYAPLEQVQGAGTDVRSDLYALAATLYHLLTGVVPPDALSRAFSSVSGQPDPLRPADALNPGVPRAVAAVLEAALSMNPGSRPPTARAMRAALREADPNARVTQAEAGPARTGPPRSPETVPLAPPTQAQPSPAPSLGGGGASTYGGPPAAPTAANSTTPRAGRRAGWALGLFGGAAALAILLMTGLGLGIWLWAARATPAPSPRAGDPRSADPVATPSSRPAASRPAADPPGDDDDDAPAGLPPALSAGAEWYEFACEEGKFSVLMPAAPLEKGDDDGGLGMLDMKTYTVDLAGGDTYTVSYSDLPPSLAPEPSAAGLILDAATDGAVSHISGTEVKKTSISIGGHPGREVSAKSEDIDGAPGTFRARMYLVEGRVYQLLAVARDERSLAAVDKFFGSFRLRE